MLTRGKYRRPYLEAPKTTSSKREAPLDKQTMDLLKRWRLQQRKELLTFGHNSISKDQLLFSNPVTNSFVELTTPRKWLASIIKEYDLKRITLHGLRHTAATMLLESGLTLQDVADRLGHSSIELLANTIYTSPKSANMNQSKK